MKPVNLIDHAIFEEKIPTKSLFNVEKAPKLRSKFFISFIDSLIIIALTNIIVKVHIFKASSLFQSLGLNYHRIELFNLDFPLMTLVITNMTYHYFTLYKCDGMTIGSKLFKMRKDTTQLRKSQFLAEFTNFYFYGLGFFIPKFQEKLCHIREQDFKYQELLNITFKSELLNVESSESQNSPIPSENRKAA